MNEKKVPGIRFKGFEDDWEQRKLSDVVGTTYGGGTPATYNDAFWNGDIPWIQTSNTVEDQLFDIEVNKCISNDGLNHSAAQMIPGNSVAVVTHVGVGKLVFMPYSYTTSQDFISLSNLKCNPKFLCYALYRKLREDLHIVQGSAIKGITKEDLMTKQFAMPEIEEQGQIASTLELLDDLITLHQRKLEKLKIVKKSMLENCFPKNGEKVPKFRFAGFTDDWEQRKVGELTTELTEYATMNSKLPLFTSSRNGLMYQSECRGSLTTNSKKTMFSVVPLGACTYRHMSDDDIFHLNINTLEKGIVSREYPVFVATDKNDIRFIVQFINSSPTFLSFCTQQKKGGTRTRLYYKTLCDFKMMVPETTEQKKIANFFQGVDQVITLHQRKLKYMDQHRNWGDLYGSL